MTPPVAIESDLSVQVQSDSESRPSKTAPSIEIVEEAPHQGPTPAPPNSAKPRRSKSWSVCGPASRPIKLPSWRQP